MDHLMPMRAFVEAVKRGNLSNAAETLGISRTLVSRHIQGLEERLAVRLMNRTTRSLVLTEAGEKYFVFCDDMLAQVDAFEQEISAERLEAKGELAVMAPKWMAETTADALIAFAKQHPGIEPRLMVGSMSQTAYDFLEQKCEVAIYIRRVPDSRIVARKVASVSFDLCAAPAYLERRGEVVNAAQLPSHDGVLHYEQSVWHLTRGDKTERVQLRGAFTSNTYAALRVAALQGVGVAQLPRPLIAEDLAAGRLVPVLPEWRTEEQPIYVAVAPGGGTPERVRLFLDFASHWFKANAI